MAITNIHHVPETRVRIVLKTGNVHHVFVMFNNHASEMILVDERGTTGAIPYDLIDRVNVPLRK